MKLLILRGINQKLPDIPETYLSAGLASFAQDGGLTKG
jgi:hypothetical protein